MGALVNPFWYAAPPPSGNTWNPADKGAEVALTGGDLIATGTGTSTCLVRSVNSFTSGAAGLYYFELIANDYTNAIGGIGTAALAFTNTVTYGSAGIFDTIATNFIFRNGAYASSGVALSPGDRINVAIDSAALKMWFGKNGTYILSGNPAGGTNQSANLTNATVYFPIAHVQGIGTIVTAHFASGSWVDSAPSGFGEL